MRSPNRTSGGWTAGGQTRWRFGQEPQAQEREVSESNAGDVLYILRLVVLAADDCSSNSEYDMVSGLEMIMFALSDKETGFPFGDVVV